MADLKKMVTQICSERIAKKRALAEWMREYRKEFEDKYLSAARELSARMSGQYTEEEIQMMAEILAIDDLFIPPDYTSWAECERCGTVMIHRENTCGIKIKSCPWCATPKLKGDDDNLLLTKG